MAAEMKREARSRRVGPVHAARPTSQLLYVVVKKDTVPPGNPGPNWVGLAGGVQLKSGATIYRSDHFGTGGLPDWSLQRDDPAATTVELPAGRRVPTSPRCSCTGS